MLGCLLALGVWALVSVVSGLFFVLVGWAGVSSLGGYIVAAGLVFMIPAAIGLGLAVWTAIVEGKRATKERGRR